MSNTPTRRRSVAHAIGVATTALALIGGALATGTPSADAVDAPATYQPIVTHTGTGPTGYAVTFRYYAPDATRVQIKGEWYFERPSELDPDVGSATTPTVPTQGILPAGWKAGDVPIAYPNSSAGNWPVADLTKDANGVWTYTTPLPSGTFSYGFFVNCADDLGTGCTQVSDPSNLPWNQAGGTVIGNLQASSQVYVPADPAFGATDYSWQAPAAKQGTVTPVTYPSPGHTTPANQQYAVVYTPPGYDPNRAAAYPTLYLSHGGGGNETDWTTQGAADNIIDQLIASGDTRPMVVVMVSNNGYPSSTFNDAQDQDVINNLIPWVEQHYNVVASADGRAFAGLSAGGILTNSFMLKYPDTFGTYDEMSAGLPSAYNTLTTAQATALRDKDITLASGRQDPIWPVGFGSQHTGGLNQAAAFAKAGLDFTTTMVDGGHEWYVWRLLLADFLKNSALFAPAKVAAPAAPTLKLQPTVSQTVATGAPVTLLALADASPAPSVQWQVSATGSTWTNVPGATSEAYTFGAAQGTRHYRAAFTNVEGSTYSAVADVTARTATTVKAKLAKAKVSTAKRATIKVTVSPAAVHPDGTVTVHIGAKTVKATLRADGTVSVKLPKLKKGTYKVYATYAGSTTGLAASTSAKVKLKVTKA